MHRKTVGLALLLLGCFTALPASAHFKLLKPASWLNEDSVGGPQKGGPCGPGGMGLLGDDVQPVPTNGTVSEVHAGDTVMIEIDETIAHPGYFRVALAKDRSAFTTPPLDDATACSFDLNAVPTGAHDNVLADGLFKEQSQPSSGRQLMTSVKLPDEPCEKCTLQVIQVMLNHGLSSCFYYHCADLKILPATGSTGAAGASGSSAAGTSGAAGTSAAAGTPATPTAGTAAMPSAGAASAPMAGSAAPISGAAGTASGAAGRAGSTASATAGSVASPSGAAGALVAGTGSTTSGASIAGASGSTNPVASAPADSSGCSVVEPGLSGTSSGLGGGSALLVASFVVRMRRRRALDVRTAR